MPDTKPTKQMMLEIVPITIKPKSKSKPKTLLEQHTSQFPSGPTNTSTFRLALTQQTDSIRRGGGAGYNPDIEPYQDSMLKKHSSLNLDNPAIREEFYESSQMIKLHTRDQLWKIIAQGWDYLSPTKCEACQDGTTQIDSEACTCEKIHTDIEWTKHLEDTIIEATGRAMTIDTAFVSRWDNGTYEWFTRNDIRNQVYVTDPYRKIEEVYFNYSKIDSTNPIKIKTGNRYRLVGFLTQHSEVDSREARFTVMKNSSKGKLLSDTLFRDCVVIQPKPSPRSVFGLPLLKIELETSSQKKYLRSYEFSYMHTGGVKKTTVIPSSADDTVRDTVVRDTQRGVFSRGVVMNVNTQKGKSVNDMILVDDQQYGAMPFGEINGMINEDAELSKQSIEGQAESGALGGNAPVVNFNMDEIARDSLYIMMEEIIRNVNRVFFDVPDYEPKVIKLKESNRDIIRREATYRIAFRKPQFVAQPGAEDPDEAKDVGTNTSATKSTAKPKPKPTTKKEENSIIIEAHSVALDQPNPGYVTFQGNMFANGWYKYPERDKERYVEYTADEIRDVTNEPVKTHVLELDHSESISTAFYDRNIGYSEIIGFDEENKIDITNFNIREELEEELKAQKIIYKNTKGKWTVDVSPKFGRRDDPTLGRKRLFLKNNAVVDPNTSQPRARLTGLDTSARKV